jgi:hypothetical protein
MIATLYRDFRYSILITIICLAAAYSWGHRWADGPLAATWVTIVLGFMEVTLSFDNAVVNASILRDMDAKWRQLFLTVGILIAVFGMRLVFPIAIVAVTTGMGWIEVTQMALTNPDEYSRHLHENHTAIASFGGIFLLLVFFSFLFDDGRKLHWLGWVERRLASLGKLEAVGIVAALLTLYAVQRFLPVDDHHRLVIMTAGVSGVILFVLVDSLGSLFEVEEEGEEAVKVVKRSGAMSFVYLEILDASFSFDGVIGAFAITRDVVIIMLGLAIGAMFVRSLTIFLVNRGTLEQYVYLEHGAHYAIGALAIIMFISIAEEVPEALTGAIGMAFIIAALFSSVMYRRKMAREGSS